MLLAARFITGIAAAFMTPAGLSLITTNFPEGARRNKAVLIYAGAAAAGYSLGLVVGGVLTAISWRWVFFAPVILASVVLLLAKRLIVDERSHRKRERFDLFGAVLMTAAMLSATFGIVCFERIENAPIGLMALAVSALSWMWFVKVEHRALVPLVRFEIFRSRALVRANVSMLLLGGSFFGFQFIVTLYLQELLGWSALHTGLALIVVSIDAVLAPTLTPRLVNRFGHARVILAGFMLALFAYALFLRLDLDWRYAAMFPTMLLLGLAFALAYGPLTIVATNGVAEHEQGLASSLVNTAFQCGAALGVSAVSAVTAIGLHTGTASGYLQSMRVALLVPVIAAGIGLAANSYRGTSNS
jgi:MFS family permease